LPKAAAPAPTSVGEYTIGLEELVSMAKNQNISALQQYGGASLLQRCRASHLIHFDEVICFANILSFCLIQVKGLSNLLKSIPDRGISGDEVDILKRKNAFGTNTYPRKKGKSFWVHSLSSIFISNYS